MLFCEVGGFVLAPNNFMMFVFNMQEALVYISEPTASHHSYTKAGPLLADRPSIQESEWNLVWIPWLGPSPLIQKACCCSGVMKLSAACS
jgi:hypothetical protein